MPENNMQKSKWRFFPYVIIACLAFVVVVDSGFIWTAVKGFPGAADDHAFNVGNNYNEILERAKQQAALDWRLDVKVAGRAIEVTLTDKDGAPLPGLVVQAVATHPVGPALPTSLAFLSDGSPHYVATAPLPSSGQWDLGLTAIAGGTEYRITRRIFVQ